ncbi:MAG: T9SS type B sorting domain-containing protein [Algibacter sp.]
MRKPTYANIGLLVLLLLVSFQMTSQNRVPFAPRYDEAIKGDMLLIGNSNVGIHVSDPYNGNDTNDRLNAAVHVDIDGDSSTFNSSSADLDIPDDVTCYQIVYAGLYWSGVVNGSTPISDVKFKTPGGSYVDITGTQIYFQNASNNNNSNSFAYYHDVTPLVTALANPEGTYSVANISSMVGPKPNSEGLSAGWSLFVIYEDPLLPSKYITSFDGFTKITSTINETIPISGFRTIPTGPVRAKYAFSTIEGDRRWTGDYLELNGTAISATNNAGTVIRESDNFFNSTASIIDPVTNTPEILTARNPDGSNTLGFDAGIINIPNAGNTIIANGATDATISLGSNLDIYYFYFNAFAIEIIAPNIVLTKIVEDESGNDIGGQLVDLGDELNYVIGFQNTGNDDATDLIIRDILPINIVFNYPADLGLLPSGVTVQSYDATTRELVFRVDESVVQENDPLLEIRLKATVVATCSLLNDACSNIISNQAFSTYRGTINPTFTISDDPSFATNTGCLLTPAATNFLADINCTFEEDVILCGASTVLTAGDGYDTYSWSTSATGTPVIGTTQSITVTEVGTYYVFNTAIAPCQNTDQVFEVITFGANVTNPVIPFADQVVTCPNDGKELPNFFLCGANDSRSIQTGITDTNSIIWERLNEASCTAVANQDCANEDAACTWSQVETGPDYLIDESGQYRLTLNYTGGCFNQFYFNVYENLLIPTATSSDIICITPGQITVGNVPSGYEYSIDNVNYQPSNIFSITTPDIYTVYIRQIGVTPNPCTFTVPDIQIRQRDFTVSSIITQPYCNGELGSVVLAANDVRPQYFFSIFQGGALVNSVGPIVDSSYEFENLNPGIYTVNVSTEDGCIYAGDIEIIDPPLLTATSALTVPLTCTDGEITVYPVGGTPPYYYFVNSTTVFQGTPIIDVTAGGTFNITVVDSNNCSADTSITVNELPEPDYNISKTDILCYDSNTGIIQFNVVNANGYTLEYSIDNGVTYTNSTTFSNLSAGTYMANIKYSLSGVDCFSASEDIIITQPDTTLTASSGVSELAGCGPSGGGRIRITNPQGGTPFAGPNFYEYSFDNQVSWVTTNEMYVTPGTYTLYIRDANGCIYAMPDIVLDPEPVAPTINVGDPDFNCDGSANTTVTVTTQTTDSFTYSYLLDGVENTNTADPKTFLNVPDGSHTITVEYLLSSVPTYSNLLNETFGYGDDTSSPGINPTYYCFERQVVATQCKNSIRIQDGDYSVTSNIVNPYDPWVSPVDHTPATNPVTPKGRFLVVNIGASIPVTEILYEKFIDDIIPNQPINVEFFAMNLLESGNTQFNPDLVVSLVDASGIEISSFATGDIPKTETWENYPKTPMTLDPGANTSLRFTVRSNVQQTSGNDVAIDDIKVYQLPQACVTEVQFPFVVNPGNEFDAQILSTNNVSCFGANDGDISIAAQNFDPINGFQYSIDNGLTWTTQMTSPHTITGLAAGSYDIQIRYEDAVSTCSFAFTEIITSPAVLEVNASGTPITCLVGSTITATATGGTLAYSYELLDTATLNLIANFPSNGVLTNIAAGDYTIRVTDANNCTDTDTLNLLGVLPPSATINTSSDYCYDTTNGASLEINTVGGLAPYEYSINGGAFITNNVFSNLTPDTYTVIVRDANGCTVTLPAETIESELVFNTVLDKDLDCTVSPDASITGTFSGGYAPFTYAVSFNSGAYSSLGTTTSPFTYTTAIDGTYQFQITDARGCTQESSVSTINAITLPEIDSVTEIQSILCHGDSNAAIDIIINNAAGTPAFTLNVNNDTTGVNYGTQTSGLTAGTYTITLTDSKSCVDTETISIAEPTPIVVNHHADPITCIGAGITKGSVVVDNVTGGTGPYNYFVTGNNGYFDSELNNTGTLSTTFDIVDFGLYQINVVDVNGCSVLIQDVIVAAPPNQLDIVVTITADCTVGGSAEVAVGSALAGSGPFHFAIYTGPGMIYTSPTTAPWQDEDAIGSKKTTFDNLIPGATYTFIVYDEDTLCYYYQEASAPVPTNSSLTADALVPNNITCVGSVDGNVNFDITSIYGADTDVTYEVFDAQTLVTTGVTGLGTVPANGVLTVSNLGGLDFGNFVVVIEETTGPFIGCGVVTVPFNITESAISLDITAQVYNNANCNLNSGLITAIATDGTAPYLYQLTTSATPPVASDPSWATANTFNVDANSYYAHVIDTNGCIVSTPVIVLINDPEPIITATLNTQCSITEGNFEVDVVLTTAGIAPHSYSIDGGAFQNRTAPFTISNLSSGTHTIEVQDANGCGNTETVTIETPIGITPAVTALPTCLDNDGEITVTASGGTGAYTYAISPNPVSIIPSGNVFTGVPSGTYTITITDTATLCTSDASVTLSAATPVTFTSTPTNTSCIGNNDGAITVNLPSSNDNPIYTYEIIAGPSIILPQSSNIFTGLATGTYTVRVNSGRGCFNTEDVLVGEPNVITMVAPTVIEYACSAGLNSPTYASITVNGVIGGSGVYTNYEFIKGGSIVQDGINNSYTEADLSGGNYTINVYDDNGCIGSTTAIIEPFASIETIDITIDNAITCTNDEDITVSVTSSGVTPINIEYLVEDIDSAGVLGGIFSQTNSTGVFTGLPIGNYLITASNLDTGCSLQSTHYVNDPNTFDLTIDSVVDVTCFNDIAGSVNVTFIDRVATPTDDSGAFNYNIVDSLGSPVTSGVVPNAGPTNISGLAAGTYTITATLSNTPFCTVVKNFTISAPTSALAISETHTEITCISGNNDGTISASATGGWPGGYEYQLELSSGTIITSYSSVFDFTGLLQEDYIVRARDSKGCVSSANVSLVNPPLIDATVIATPSLLSCFGDANATITVSAVTGGQGSNYSYTLNMVLPTVTSSGPQIASTFDNLGAGTYTVTVTDGYNCEFTSANVVIAEPTQIQASLVKNTSQTCLIDASLTLSATGGTGTYEYSDSITFATIINTFASSTTFSVTDGTYMYYVRDANGCVSTISNEITIDPLPTLMANLEATAVTINCAGDNTGAITATAQGGLGSYVYTLQDMSGTDITPVTQDSPGVFTNLTFGNYQVQVDSGDCLTTSAQITITEPTVALSAIPTVSHITCPGINNGILEIAATGGTGLIKYAISPRLDQFFETSTFDELAPGTYQAVAQDELGCFIIIDFTIDDATPISLSIVSGSIIPEVCEGDMDGEFSVSITGGNMPYSVAIDDINGTYTTGTLTQTDFEFLNLGGGDHLVYVRDDLGCETEWNITFPESVLIDPQVVVDYDCINNLSTNTVTVTVDDSITDLTDLDYSLNGGTYQASNIFIDVPPGINHYIDVRHTNGCEKQTLEFDIADYQPLELALSDGNLNEIVATATGGSGIYEYDAKYEFNSSSEPFGDTNTYIIYESGEYTVTVTDSFGCTVSATRYFEYIDVCITNYFTPNGDGTLDRWGPGCTTNYKDLTFDIFDRYGRKVATLGAGEKWDGTYKGAQLPTGDYWYVVKLNDKKDDRDFVGNFTLYR